MFSKVALVAVALACTQPVLTASISRHSMTTLDPVQNFKITRPQPRALKFSASRKAQAQNDDDDDDKPIWYRQPVQKAPSDRDRSPTPPSPPPSQNHPSKSTKYYSSGSGPDAINFPGPVDGVSNTGAAQQPTHQQKGSPPVNGASKKTPLKPKSETAAKPANPPKVLQMMSPVVAGPITESGLYRIGRPDAECSHLVPSNLNGLLSSASAEGLQDTYEITIAYPGIASIKSRRREEMNLPPYLATLPNIKNIGFKETPESLFRIKPSGAGTYGIQDMKTNLTLSDTFGCGDIYVFEEEATANPTPRESFAFQKVSKETCLLSAQ